MVSFLAVSHCLNPSIGSLHGLVSVEVVGVVEVVIVGEIVVEGHCNPFESSLVGAR